MKRLRAYKKSRRNTVLNSPQFAIKEQANSFGWSKSKENQAMVKSQTIVLYILNKC